MPYWKAFLLTPVIVAVIVSMVALVVFLVTCAIKFITSIFPLTVEHVWVGILLLILWPFIAFAIQDTGL